MFEAQHPSVEATADSALSLPLEFLVCVSHSPAVPGAIRSALHFMNNLIIHGILAASVFIAGCVNESPSSSVASQPAAIDARSAAPAAQLPERAIVTKARSIVLPEFKLDRVTLTEALVQLRNASRQNDPEKEGVNFLITNQDDAGAVLKNSLALKNTTLEEATKRLAEAAGVSVSARDYAFVFGSEAR